MTTLSTLVDADLGVITEEQVRRALDVVIDPELDEPITDLGFVRSVTIDATRIEVHLRLPTSFCSPSFAYLMVSDAKDAVVALVAGDPGDPGLRGDGPMVVVELDDHHDSVIINAGLAADAGYRGTFAHEAEDSLDELRTTFRRKAHTAAMERVLTGLLRARADLLESEVGAVVIAELPAGEQTDALLRRRTALGLGNHPDALVLVDHDGVGYAPDEVPTALRRARSTRISIDGNAHFCRGLLATRYPGAEQDQTSRPSVDDVGGVAFFPLATLAHHEEHSQKEYRR